MAIIEIEWNFGKSKADKIIIWIFQTICFFVYHFVKIFSENYKTLRSKSKVPGFTNINFRKRFFPGLVLFVVLPLILILVVIYHLPENISPFWIGMFAIVIALFLLINFLYFIYRIIIDVFVSGVCLIKSFFATTIYFINFLRKHIDRLNDIRNNRRV